MSEGDEQPKEISPGTIIDDFEILERVGSGAFSNVHIARHIPTNLFCAAKIICMAKMKSQDITGVMREVSVFMQVDHPYICNLYRMSLHEPFLIFFIEFATKGTLLDYVNSKKGLNEFEAQKFFIQIFAALRHLHIFHFCVHRDLKLENIMIDASGNVRLTDFGLSNSYYNNIMKTFVGTPGYQPPEILAGNEYNEKCDVWSLGICLYAILTATLPFSSKNCSFRMLVEEVSRFKYPPNFSPALVDLLKKMLEISPSNRPTLIQLQTHPWLRGLPQLAVNIAPQPVIFYKVTSKALITKFKRRPFNPDPAILEKCATMGINTEELANNLKNGITDNNTTTYFMLLRPLSTKPSPPKLKEKVSKPIPLPNKKIRTPTLNKSELGTRKTNGKALPPSRRSSATKSYSHATKAPILITPHIINNQSRSQPRTNPVFSSAVQLKRRSANLKPLRQV